MNNKDHQVNWLGCSLVWQAAGELQRHIYLAAPLVGATLPIGLVSYVRGLRTQRRRQKWTKQLQIYLWLISSEVNTVEMGKKAKAFYGTPSQLGQLRIQPQPHLTALNEWTGPISLSNLRKFHSQTGSATQRVESQEKSKVPPVAHPAVNIAWQDQESASAKSLFVGCQGAQGAPPLPSRKSLSIFAAIPKYYGVYNAHCTSFETPHMRHSWEWSGEKIKSVKVFLCFVETSIL